MGLFVVIEGCDGAGKTSQSKALAAALGGEWMCFPDRTTYFGKLVDGWLKQHWHAHSEHSDDQLTGEFGLPPEREIDAAVFQALQTVNRLEVADKIAEAKSTPGALLVCDRYWMSGYAYGVADGLNPELMRQIHTVLPSPSFCILLDVPLDVIDARMRHRESKAKRDLYESRGPDYFAKVHRAYDALWARLWWDPRWKRMTVDAQNDFEATQNQLLRYFNLVDRG